jgi:hypothetical protein
MKFQASVVFELKAGSIAEAGQRLDQLLNHAEDHHEMAANVVELRTPPVDLATAPPIALPPVTTPARMPGPQAEGLEGLSSGNRSGPQSNSAG